MIKKQKPMASKSPSKNKKRGSAHELRDVPEHSDLRQLFEEQLADIYYAEKKLVGALPKMVKAAMNSELKSAIEQHLEETRGQVEGLEEVFSLIGKTAKGTRCEAMDGLLEEANELLTDFKGSDAIDAALICGAQKVEHYEIATYGCLIAWARQLGLDDAADRLDQILEEEKGADEKLTELAEQVVNQQAE